LTGFNKKAANTLASFQSWKKEQKKNRKVEANANINRLNKLYRVPTPSPFLYAREGRYKSIERGNYPPPPHWDLRTIQPTI
jgi:hypothetical protein